MPVFIEICVVILVSRVGTLFRKEWVLTDLPMGFVSRIEESTRGRHRGGHPWGLFRESCLARMGAVFQLAVPHHDRKILRFG
jgi:hypothetical protein